MGLLCTSKFAIKINSLIIGYLIDSHWLEPISGWQHVIIPPTIEYNILVSQSYYQALYRVSPCCCSGLRFWCWSHGWQLSPHRWMRWRSQWSGHHQRDVWETQRCHVCHTAHISKTRWQYRSYILINLMGLLLLAVMMYGCISWTWSIQLSYLCLLRLPNQSNYILCALISMQ